MPPLRLTDGKSSLEIDLASWDGDALITVIVESRGFTGRHELYGLADQLRAFCESFFSLQRTLKGEARLTAIQPDELDIVVALADVLGHIEVTGHPDYDVQMPHMSYRHAVHFGFQVEPTQLDAAVKVPWVTEYAV